MTEKLHRQGILIAVQPRIRLLRSFDESTHSYISYVSGIHGTIGDEKRGFFEAVVKGAHLKHGFKAGGFIQALCAPVQDPCKEIAESYKVSRLKVLEKSQISWGPPPWPGCSRDLETYRPLEKLTVLPAKFGSGVGWC